MKPLLLRLHRWVALVFALPLLIVIVTGLILAFEPAVVMQSVRPGTLTADKLLAIVAAQDPGGRAQGIVHRAYEQTVTVGAGRGGGVTVDTGTGKVLSQTGGLADVFMVARRMHEKLLIEAGAIVIASSAAMLVLCVLGALLGWPRFANTLGGWHAGTAWVLMPLLILSPLTGLLLSAGITFAGAPPAPVRGGDAEPIKLADAVRIAGARHDLSGLVWLRMRGNRMLLRIVEGGEYRIYTVDRQGTTALPRNWPRLWHEGNFAGSISTLPNIATSLAALLLLVSGVWIWGRRKLRLRARQREKRAQARA